MTTNTKVTAKQWRKTIITTQDGIFKSGAEFNKSVHENALECIRFAEKHHDVTLAERLVAGLQKHVPGYVVAGLVKWFKTYSPVTIDTDDKGNITGSHQAKEGDRGYKPYSEENTEAAAKAPFQVMHETTSRSNKPMEPISIELFKKMWAGRENMLNKAIKTGERPITGDPETIRVFIKAVSEFMNKVSVMPTGVKEPVKVDKKQVKAARLLRKGREVKDETNTSSITPPSAEKAA